MGRKEKEMNKGKKALLKARRERGRMSTSDIIQIELRNEGIKPDIRKLINACPPNSRG